jgi:putative ATPase
MQELGYGEEYQYDHDHAGGVATDQSFLPERLAQKVYYEPTDRGLEGRIAERVRDLQRQRRDRDSADKNPDN